MCKVITALMYGPFHNSRYSDNQRAQDAINVTFFHWGIHGWIVYVIVGLLLAYMTYNRGLPMTMRSCFYPLLGDKIFGFLGDVIDVISIIATMFGVCTSLGIGAVQLNGGLRRLNRNIKDTIDNQIIIIWCITALATISVVTGIKVGIRRLSEICFAVGMFLLLVVLFYDDTWYLLNVTVQSTGYYLQWVVQLGFHTDAFAQLGNAPDGKEKPGWMNDWTILYWGWWIAWSPFVGMFIAKISRGRTIKQFITCTLTIPIIYSFLWFGIMGGAGIKMERNAALAGVTCNSSLGGTGAQEAYNDMYRLSCRGKNEMFFDLMRSYGDTNGFKDFMSIMTLLGIVLYFVTSSDSGSLVIDCLAANGSAEPPVLQRIFWAFTEGACASVLLKAGGTEALAALQSMAICTGLLYTVILNVMCVALWRALKMEAGDLDPNGPCFSVDLLQPLFKLSWRRVRKLLVATTAPWWPMGIAAAKLNRSKPLPYMLVLAIPFYGWVVLEALQVFETGLAYVGWVSLCGFFAYGTGIRANIREKYGINGNMFEDFFAVILAYPLAAMQMEEHMKVSSLLETDEEVGSDSSGSSEKIDGMDEDEPLKSLPHKRANQKPPKLRVTVL